MCANLPNDSAIFYFTFGTDAHGGAYADERVLAEIHARANAPMFGAFNVFLGSGIVGGTLMAVDELARNTADVAGRLLDGESPRSIRLPPQARGQSVFDWRELQRWGIAESRLPPGSVVRFRSPSLWSEYKVTMLSAAGALVVQSLLIVGLLYQRRARRRAELESRRNLALATDASRRETMSALTSSIAHELGQPLSSMIHNAHALLMMVRAQGASAVTIEEILSDIQAQGVLATQIIERHRTMLRSRQLQKKPIDLQAVVDESLALLAHDMRERKVEATLNLSSEPCVVSGDQVLLQQVMVNLVLNAMDAMTNTPPSRRHITITSQVKRCCCRSFCARHWNGLAGGCHHHVVYAIRHHEIPWPRNRPDDRPDNRRGARRHDRGPQQPRRRRDVLIHAAPLRHPQVHAWTAKRSMIFRPLEVLCPRVPVC